MSRGFIELGIFTNSCLHFFFFLFFFFFGILWVLLNTIYFNSNSCVVPLTYKNIKNLFWLPQFLRALTNISLHSGFWTWNWGQVQPIPHRIGQSIWNLTTLHFDVARLSNFAFPTKSKFQCLPWNLNGKLAFYSCT